MVDRSEPLASAPRRRRGVILSSQGWQRLQAAEQLLAARQNDGSAYTLEALSVMTGLSANTLTKVRRRQKMVDHQTLEIYFQAFGLVLDEDDFLSSEEANRANYALDDLCQTPLKGQLELTSPFYIYRSPAERLSSEEVLRPGALVRIKAPRQFGKTSLVARTLSSAQDRGLRTAMLSFQLADRQIFSNLDLFLRWLCAMTARALGIPPQLEERWDMIFGGSYSCSHYFETYLLGASEEPLLLVLDEVNEVFNYPDVATDFFGMLRAWYEQGRYGTAQQSIWQRLRLMLIHSTEAWLPFNVNQSPFNVGLSIELPGFTTTQVQELALRYGLAPGDLYAESLNQLINGNPYLTQLSLFHLSKEGVALEQLLGQAIAPESIFSSHLRYQLNCLYDDAALLEAMKAVVAHPMGVRLPPSPAFRLQGMGLVRFQEGAVVPSCQLYQRYFAQALQP